MQVIDLPREQIIHQLNLVASAVSTLKQMIEAVPAEDRPASVDTVVEYKRRYLAQLLLIADVVQSLASKSFLPTDLYKTTDE